MKFSDQQFLSKLALAVDLSRQTPNFSACGSVSRFISDLHLLLPDLNPNNLDSLVLNPSVFEDAVLRCMKKI